ncbi:MAG TPA: SdrD B-like domain-containing protein [Urbifossiella sp.]|nr:SdrD B-like domain-containing protein [Urbifossiella sp.]
MKYSIRSLRRSSPFRLEVLEDRSVPSTVYADSHLPLGATLASLGARLTDDRDSSGTLSVGDQVTVALGDTGETAKLTFGEAAVSGDVGSAFGTIQDAVNFAAAGDTVQIAPGTYAENVTVGQSLMLEGSTGTAADVVIAPTTGTGVSVSADGVTVRDLSISGAADGVAATAAAAGLTLMDVVSDGNANDGVKLAAAGGTTTLTDVTVNGNGSAGLDLTGTAGSKLTVSGLTDTNNTGAGITIAGFSAVDLTNVTLTGNGAANSLGASAGGTINFTATTGTTPFAITASGSQLQFTSQGAGGNVVNEPIAVVGAAALNLTGGGGADTFAITPAATGGATISVNGGLPSSAIAGTAGDTLNLLLSGITGTNFTTTFLNGFTGSMSSTGHENVAFSGIESFAGGAAISGTVFNDANGNGSQNGNNEMGLAGITVGLDVDADGTADVTTTTDPSGRFSFTGLPPGTYRMRVVPPAGAAITTSLPADISAILGGTTTGLTFGLHFGGGTTGTSTVTGIAFSDVNKNGIKDSGEVGVNLLTVFLDLNGNGKLDRNEPSTVTSTVNGVAGSFTLTSNVVGGSAQVRVVQKPGFLENTTNAAVSLVAGATETVDVGVSTHLPPQATPAKRFAVGIVQNLEAKAGIFDGDGKEDFSVSVPGSFPGGVRVATGDVTGDGVDDVIVASGPGTVASVTVFDGVTHKQIFTTNPFGSFTGGAFVTVGDVTGDGTADLIITPDEGGGPRVVVIRGGDFQTILSFFGIDDPNFRGGARAGFGDMNGDGRMDLLVAAGLGGGPRVSVFDGAALAGGRFSHVINDFFAFDPVLRNGVFLAGGDVDGDGIDDLIIGAGPGGGPRVLVLSGATLLNQGIAAAIASPLDNFFAGDANNRGGVRVASKDLDGDGRMDIVTGDGNSGQVTGFRGDDGSKLFNFNEQDDRANTDGIFVG